MAVIELTEKNFEQEVLKAESTVLVDLWAPWCGPCQMMGPVVDELSEEHPEVKFCKLNVDENMNLARRYQVAAIPTFLVFKNGEAVERCMGAQPKEQLEAAIR